MARGRPTPEGICHLCGEYGPLSFEHVPPAAAFNDRPVVRVSFEAIRELDPEDVAPGPIEQRGSGGYTLCRGCNNFTGKYYGTAFTSWCEQGMRVLLASRGDPRLTYPYHLLPLKVLKQLVTMFMSVNAPGFQSAHPELVHFVLDRQARFLSPRYRFFVYFAGGGRNRFFGLSIASNFQSGRMTALSEIAFPPFGYVMTIESEPPDPRLCEITHFARYTITDFKDVPLAIRHLPTAGIMPGDYRPIEEVRTARREGQAAMQRRAAAQSSGEALPSATVSPNERERMMSTLYQAPRLYSRLSGDDEG